MRKAVSGTAAGEMEAPLHVRMKRTNDLGTKSFQTHMINNICLVVNHKLCENFHKAPLLIEDGQLGYNKENGLICP